MNYYQIHHKKFLIGVAISLLLLGACSGGPDRDMKEFVKKVREKQPKPLPSLPVFPPYKSFKYAAGKLRSPFESAMPVRINTAATNQKGPMPNLNRPKEPLESFSLDALQMVGTLAREGAVYALIKDSKGLIYRVGIGSYIGQNYGQIEKINSTGLDIKEWVLSSKGEWQTRNTSLRFGKKPAK
jgi:type IV pilus assembly protein PilP